MAYVIVAWSAPDAEAAQVRGDLLQALRDTSGVDPIELLPRLMLYRDGDVSIDFVRGLVQSVVDGHPNAEAVLTSPRRSTSMKGWVHDVTVFDDARPHVNQGNRRTFPEQLGRQ